METSRGIQKQHIITTQRGLSFRPLGDLHRSLALDDRQAVNAHLTRQNRQLLHRGRTVGVQRRQKHLLAVLFLQPLGQLRGGRGFPRPLQTDHQNRTRRVVDLQRIRSTVARQHMHQLVVNDLHHLLARRDRLRHRLPRGLDLHRLDEIPRDRQRDIGLKERRPNLAQRRINIGLTQGASLGQLVKDRPKAFGKALKHQRILLTVQPQQGGGGGVFPSPKRNDTCGRNALADGDPSHRAKDRKHGPPGNSEARIGGNGGGVKEGRQSDRERRRTSHHPPHLPPQAKAPPLPLVGRGWGWGLTTAIFLPWRLT